MREIVSPLSGIRSPFGVRRASGPQILLSASSIAENAVVGSTVGVLSVVNGTGTWTFTKTADPNAKFVLAGTGGANLNTAAGFDFETAQSHSVTIQATNGTETISRTFAIGVTNVFEQPTLSALSVPASVSRGTTISITGATAGSTITGTMPTGWTLNGAARTIAIAADAPTGSQAWSLTETLPDSANSPRVSSESSEVSAEPTGPLDFVGYGQSNWLFHVDRTNGQPAAHPDTFMWNFTTNQWVEPTGNGLRTFLNEMQAATGRVCRIVYGGNPGTDIQNLSKGAGTNHYENLIARIVASGANPSYMLWHQGENNGGTDVLSVGEYQTRLDTLHGNVAADTGRTRATMPLINASLGPTNGAIIVTDFNGAWSRINDALATANDRFPHIHYSHSFRMATLADADHFTGPDYGYSGRSYARTINFLRGAVSTIPNWTATSAERVNATSTRVTLTHSMGTDFTPSTGITGFEVSNDGGITWVSATGVREDSTNVILTHADLGTVERRIRYQFGRLPDVSGGIRDNSAFANPLRFTLTPAPLVAAGATALPSLSFAGRLRSGQTTQNQTVSFIPVAGKTESVLAIIGLACAGGNPATSSLSVTAIPSGTVVSATLVAQEGTTTTPKAELWQAVLPVGTIGIELAIAYAANPFGNSRVAVSTVPVASLNSTTPVGSGSRAATVTSVTTNIAIQSGGIVVAYGVANSNVAGPLSFAGTAGVAMVSADSFGYEVAFGHRNNASANASASVTSQGSTANTANHSIAVAAWR